MTSSGKKWQLVAGLFLSVSFCACADLLQDLPEMGDLQSWAIFSLGNSTSGDRFSDNANIQGDVAGAGNGQIHLGGNATIDGAVYWHSNGNLEMSNNAKITGSRGSNRDSDLDGCVNDAMNISDTAFAFAPTRSNTAINLSGHKNLTVTGAPGETVVLKLQNFLLAGNATFTLEGTGTTAFIINVTKKFSLSDRSSIVLSGGLTWDNVLFNVRGARVALSDHSSLSGTLMVNDHAVNMSGHSIVQGQVVANRVLLSDAAQVIHPPVASP
jgi:Ice-binding-like